MKRIISVVFAYVNMKNQMIMIVKQFVFYLVDIYIIEVFKNIERIKK